MKTIIANWKMNLGIRGSVALTKQLLLTLKGQKMAPEVIVCPGYLALAEVRKVIARSRINLGAQDLFWESQGAFTGEVSPTELTEVGVTHVIIGHSERRGILGESNEMIAKKVLAACVNGLVPIVCVGESETDHEEGNTLSVVKNQLQQAFSLVADQGFKNPVYVAYEPVWAIGSGKTADPKEVAKIHEIIRQNVQPIMSGGVFVLYGGSVNGENAQAFLSEEEIDGLLVGGASLKLGELTEIFAIAAHNIG